MRLLLGQLQYQIDSETCFIRLVTLWRRLRCLLARMRTLKALQLLVSRLGIFSLVDISASFEAALNLLEPDAWSKMGTATIADAVAAAAPASIDWPPGLRASRATATAQVSAIL